MPRPQSERRVWTPELRAQEDGIISVGGYAAVFNQDANIGGYFVERIAPGAFSEAIGRDDVVFVFNHDQGTVMARSSAGNLTLEEDAKGLRMSAELSLEDSDVQRVSAKMRAGNLSKMSFAFFADLEEWDDRPDTPIRTIKRASLVDVSVVTMPAYDATEIALRSLEQHRKTSNSNAAHRRKRLSMDLDVRERVRR